MKERNLKGISKPKGRGSGGDKRGRASGPTGDGTQEWKLGLAPSSLNP